MRDFSHLNDVQMADAIMTLAGRLAAGKAEQLELIGEFDARQAWAGPGLLSCAHWLTWRTGMSPNAARERVRIARSLPALPLIAGAFGSGRLSFSQVRALTRVADDSNEGALVELARNTTAAQLERVVRGMRRVHKIEEDTADPELAEFRMRTTTGYDQDGNFVLRLVCSAEDGALVQAALTQVQADLDRQRAAAAAEPTEAARPTEAAGVSAETPAPAVPQPPPVSGGLDVSAETSGPPETPEPVPATLTDAVLELARTALEQLATERPALARRHRAALVVQLDPLSGWGRLRDGELLPPSSMKQVLRSLPGRQGQPRLRPLNAADLNLADLGRTRREPSQRLRELLGTIDGERCRFPGCTRHRKLHAHHVIWWSLGGPTDLANLVLVCGRHHTLLHTHGFQLTLHPDRTITVTTADGTEVPHHPEPPWGDADQLDPDRTIQSATLPPDQVEPRLDLRYVVSVMSQQAA